MKLRDYTKYFFLILIISLSFSCKGTAKYHVYITGDVKSIGASIYIDNEKVGIMQEHIYTGKTSSVFVYGDKYALSRDLETKNDGSSVLVSKGKHELKIVNSENKILTKMIEINSENYFNISFENMEIKGE